MSQRKPLTRIVLQASLIIAVIGTGAWALQRGGPDAMLERSYGRVLADMDNSWSSEHARNIWLSSATGASARPVISPLPGALGIGDRIAVRTRHGAQMAIEVTELEEIDGRGVGLAGTRFQIVTGRLPEGGETVRFIFSVDQPLTAPVAPQPGRTL
jgi:hypothetical protein